MCKDIGLSETSRVKYSWEIAVPTSGDAMLTPFHLINHSTLYANSSSKLLDPMFFRSQFRVRCLAQPILPQGHLGIPLRSKPVEVSSSLAICNVHTNRLKSFVTKLSYINDTDLSHPDTVRVDIQIPHQDGMVPLISTFPIHNVKQLLTNKIYRAHHACSNLIGGTGFLADDLGKTIYKKPTKVKFINISL